MTRIGIVGCGAVAELSHLPPLLARTDCLVTALVDPNEKRLDALSRLIPDAHRATSLTAVLHDMDAAIVALPHFLHATVAGELLRAGKHVLVEKPLALSGAECDEMLAAARAGGGTITVGHMRRFCPGVAFARELLESNTIGAVRSVDVADGAVYGWPVESDFQFRREKAGGGALVDTGAHTLDMLIGWFGDVQPVSYRDDASAGVEADGVAQLRLPGGIPCRVELSRTRNLRNSAIVEAERGRMEVFFYANRIVMAFRRGARVVPFDCELHPGASYDPSPWRHMFDYQLDDWLGSITEGRPAMVSGEEGAKVVRLIEKLQAMREPLIHPWESFETVSPL